MIIRKIKKINRIFDRFVKVRTKIFRNVFIEASNI